MAHPSSKPGPLSTTILSVVTLIAFAANSLLCRGALGPGTIDPIGFTLLRIASGAITLTLIARAFKKDEARVAGAGSWTAGLALFAYALAFSFAYVSIDAGTGALILFAAVQATMIGVGIAKGERPSVLEWIGLAIAMGGLVFLLRPGAVAPSLPGSSLMAAAGVAWGVYSVLGRGTRNPVAETAGNFARALPLIAVAALIGISRLSFTWPGVVLALLSGALASGLGYALWYAALRGLTNTRAAVIQLSVPVIAAFGGLLFLAEPPTLRLAISSAMVLGGVGMAVASRKLPQQG